MATHSNMSHIPKAGSSYAMSYLCHILYQFASDSWVNIFAAIRSSKPPLLQETASELWWLSGSKEGILSELLRAVLCLTVVHSGVLANMTSY